MHSESISAEDDLKQLPQYFMRFSRLLERPVVL
jgi:hypothetical protein